MSQDGDLNQILGSMAWRQSSTNQHAVALQAKAEHPAHGDVVLDYYGHCAITLTAPNGLTLLFDPWRNDPSRIWGIWFRRDFPKLVVDVALSTHAHFDHDGLDKIEATTILDRMVGTWTFTGVTITGLADRHTTPFAGRYEGIAIAKYRDMSSYLVEIGGLRILIWGDNRADPPDEIWAAWGQVDVLTLPIDGSQHILTHDECEAIIGRLRPKVVIPTHYMINGLHTPESKLQTADAWLESRPAKQRLRSPRLILSKHAIAHCEGEVLYFGDQTQQP